MKSCAHGVGLGTPCIDCEAMLLAGFLADEERDVCTAVLDPVRFTLRHVEPCPVHDDPMGRPVL